MNYIFMIEISQNFDFVLKLKIDDLFLNSFEMIRFGRFWVGFGRDRATIMIT